MRFFLLISLIIISYVDGFSQGCCSGGVGSPIAGGVATGVMQKNQLEFSFNYQINSSDRFYNEDTEIEKLFNKFSSEYLFLRSDFGVNKRLTLSLAAGYFLNKSKYAINNANIISTGGIGDLFFFPRYSIYNKTSNFQTTSVVIGIGFKIPLNSSTDSTLTFSAGSINNYQINPPMLQLTDGSNDLMFSSFFFKHYQKDKIRFFISTLYVKKGYNLQGIKYGDYSSFSFFISKNFFRRWDITSQFKYENIGHINIDNNVEEWDLLEYQIYPESTGSKKVFFIPQLSFSNNNFTFFTSFDVPVYQFLDGTQIGSKNIFNLGVNYRFMTKKNIHQ